MFTLACKQCKAEHPRHRYRKKGGGVHSVCPSCRRRALALKHKTLYRTKTAVETVRSIEKDKELKEYKDRLVSEYLRETSKNRARIKALSENPKPTKATNEWMNKRQAVQEMWHQSLKHMLEHCHQWPVKPTLREYMTNQNDTDGTLGEHQKGLGL